MISHIPFGINQNYYLNINHISSLYLFTKKFFE